MHCKRPRASLCRCIKHVKKNKIERGETAPPSGQRCQNPAEDDGKLHPHSLGVSNGGKVLINIKANQILKHETQDPWLCINVVFICNQVMMIEYTKEARGEALVSHSQECFHDTCCFNLCWQKRVNLKPSSHPGYRLCMKNYYYIHHLGLRFYLCLLCVFTPCGGS